MAWYNRLLSVIRSDRLSAEIEREVEFHIAERVDALRAQGMSEEDARYEARRRFGNRGLQQERIRAVDLANWLDALVRDVRYAARSLRRTGIVSLFVVITFALGIGANAAIFSVVNAVLLRPLPYREPDRLVRVYESLKNQPASRQAAGLPTFTDWRAQSHTIEAFVSYQVAGRNLQAVKSGVAERVSAVNVSANAFTVLGHPTLLGRGFVPSEDNEGDNHVVVLSEGLWRRDFGADPAIIGRAVLLDDEPFRVVGVMPADFVFPAGSVPRDLWVPYTPHFAWTKSRLNHFLSVVARVKPGVTIAQANAEMKQIAARLEVAYPEQAKRTAVVVPYQDDVVSGVRRTLLVLFGAVTLVLLIACANVTGLLLARAAALRRTASVKLALGATRAHLIRQHLLESGLLAIAGATLGTGLAFGALRLLVGAESRVLPVVGAVPMDRGVFLFVLVVSVTCGLVAGVAPAFHVSGGRLRDGLMDANKRPSGTARRTRSVLVVAQLALSLTLLAGAGLLMRGFMILSSIAPGFVSDGVVTARLAVPAGRYIVEGAPFNATRASRLYYPILERLRAVPGVEAAAFTSSIPIDGSGTTSEYWIDGRAQPAPGTARIAQLRQVSPGYFGAMGIPIDSGRDFTEADGAPGLDPIIVNESFARREFPGQNPVGRRIHITRDTNNVFTVVGVVGDVRAAALDREPEPELYGTYRGDRIGLAPFSLVVRLAPSPAPLSSVRAAVASVARDAPLFSVRMMDDMIDRSLAERRFNLTLVGMFAATAVALAACGLYGLLAFAVTQRSRELAIRMALGARRSAVVSLVLRDGAAIALAGIILGLAGAAALSRFISGMLYGVTAHDPLTLAAVSVALGIIALMAAYLPARRAAGADPMTALRLE